MLTNYICFAKKKGVIIQRTPAYSNCSPTTCSAFHRKYSVMLRFALTIKYKRWHNLKHDFFLNNKNTNDFNRNIQITIIFLMSYLLCIFSSNISNIFECLCISINSVKGLIITLRSPLPGALDY